MGNPVRLILTGGHTHDSVPVRELLQGVVAEHLLADKAYDNDALIQDMQRRGINAVIPPKRNRRIQREYDKYLYKERHLIECFFCKIKEFRRVASRYEKLGQTFLTMVTIASCLIWMR